MKKVETAERKMADKDKDSVQAGLLQKHVKPHIKVILGITLGKSIYTQLDFLEGKTRHLPFILYHLTRHDTSVSQVHLI